MKRILCFVVFAFCIHNASASGQSPDFLVYKNDTVPIFHLILEDYLQSIDAPEEGKIAGLSFRENANPNCWRGYQAIYLVENDRLFLTHILSFGELYRKDKIDTKESDRKMKEIFGDRVVNNRVYADWFSGFLAIKKGDLLRLGAVFPTLFYKEEVLQIHKGRLKNAAIVDNYIKVPNGISRTSEKLITDAIFTEIEQLDWETIGTEKVDYTCDEEYIITINEKGKIGSIEINSWRWTDDKEDFKEEQKDYRRCIKSFKKQLKNLQFDIIKWHGQPYQEQLIFEIFYYEKRLENWSPYEKSEMIKSTP